MFMFFLICHSFCSSHRCLNAETLGRGRGTVLPRSLQRLPRDKAVVEGFRDITLPDAVLLIPFFLRVGFFPWGISFQSHVKGLKF